jgi:hypothetical protein
MEADMSVLSPRQFLPDKMSIDPKGQQAGHVPGNNVKNIIDDVSAGGHQA